MKFREHEDMENPHRITQIQIRLFLKLFGLYDQIWHGGWGSHSSEVQNALWITKAPLAGVGTWLQGQPLLEALGVRFPPDLGAEFNYKVDPG